MTSPTEPMLVELRTGVWKPGTTRTKSALMRRFNRSQVLTTAVLGVLRSEGQVQSLGWRGVRAQRPGPKSLTGPPTLVETLADEIRRRVHARRYVPGLRLPPQRELAEEMGVATPTIRTAMLQLMLEGVLRPHQPAEVPGTYPVDVVREKKDARLVADLRTAITRGGWLHNEYPLAVERALKRLMHEHTMQTLYPPAKRAAR